MTILTSYSASTFKAQIRSSLQNGFKAIYTATSTSSEAFAAQAVVRKYYGEKAASTVRQVTDKDRILELVGDFFRDPKRKQVFNVYEFQIR